MKSSGAKRRKAKVSFQSGAARFQGKVALVTGANDRGIGGAIAERLVSEGASIGMLSRREPTALLARLAQLNKPSDSSEPSGTNASWIPCDLRQHDQLDQTVDAMIDHFGKIDLIVNNAGIEIYESFDSLEDHQWENLIDVNLTSIVRLLRRFGLHFKKNGGGVVVNIASASGLGGTPGLSAYSATKAGLIGLTQSLAAEWAADGIRVIAVAPALVKTPMATQHMTNLSAESWQQIKAAHPIGLGDPEDVAAAVAFLASDEARWISGATLPLGWMPSFGLPVQ